MKFVENLEEKYLSDKRIEGIFEQKDGEIVAATKEAIYVLSRVSRTILSMIDTN